MSRKSCGSCYWCRAGRAEEPMGWCDLCHHHPLRVGYADASCESWKEAARDYNLLFVPSPTAIPEDLTPHHETTMTTEYKTPTGQELREASDLHKQFSARHIAMHHKQYRLTRLLLVVCLVNMVLNLLALILCS